VLSDPQVKHLSIATPVIHPRLGKLDLIDSPVNFFGTEQKIRSACLDGGQHTREIMTELGYSAQEIERFRISNVIM
jgi:crotonobetainyl-CoA:carnitine CoA-transferase CaiB-like acyl-CoA transferase